MVSDGSLPCPGGTGRKIKFCCAELGGELRQIDRLVQGGQLTAALERTKRLVAGHPGRACLLATRTKIELAAEQFDAAAATARAFLEAHPDNQLAIRQAALTAALTGRIDDAAVLFDRAREAARAMGVDGLSAVVELVGIAPVVVQSAIDAGHPGCGQAIVDWLVDTRGIDPEALRPLVEAVDSPAVPLPLRCRLPVTELAADVPWRQAFESALADARDWRLSRALEGFRGLAEQAGGCRPLLVNIGLVCEMLARPREAAEAWRAVSRLDDTPFDFAVMAIGRAIALEREAEPDRGPQVPFIMLTAMAADGVDGTSWIVGAEARLRDDPRLEETPVDESAWTQAEAAAPRSAWLLYECKGREEPARLLASLLLFHGGEERGPEIVLRGFGDDVALAKPAVEGLLGCRFEPAADPIQMPAMTPTAWLLASQFRPSSLGSPAQDQATAVRDRFIATWPDTPLPELIGRTPREAAADPEGRLRVEALIVEGDATADRPELAAAWAGVRAAVGLPAPEPILTREPLDEVLPLHWHLIDMRAVPPEQLRGVFELARDAGFAAAALLAAEQIATAGRA